VLIIVLFLFYGFATSRNNDVFTGFDSEVRLQQGYINKSAGVGDLYGELRSE